MQPHRHPLPPDMRRRAQAAFMLPVAGMFLIVPPLLSLFSGRYRVFGAPLDTVYLFTVWIVLIFGAVLVSRWMPQPDIVEGERELGDDG